MNTNELRLANLAIKADGVYYSLMNNTSDRFDILRDEYIVLRREYANSLELLKERVEGLESAVRVERDNKRKSVKWNYTIKCNEAKQIGKVWYRITATPLEVISGDEEYYKVREYQSFTIVNNVLVSCGSGYIMPLENGEILTNEEIFQIYEMEVPKRFIK